MQMCRPLRRAASSTLPGVCCVQMMQAQPLSCSHAALSGAHAAAHSWLQLPELVRLDQLHAFVVESSRVPLSYASLRTLAARLQAPAQRPRWVAHVSAQWRLARTGDRAWMQRWDADADYSEEQPADVAVTQACGISVEHPRSWVVSVLPAEPAEAAASEPPQQRTDGTTGAQATCAEAQRRGMLLHNVPIGAELQLRTRRNGDRFMPHWRQKARVHVVTQALACITRH